MEAAPEVEAESAYGLPADVFSFGVMAYELYHLASTGVEFYTESLFDGGGVVEGLSIVREPLLADPPSLPPRPDTCTIDAVWELLCACMAKDAEKRPTLAKVATEIGAARQKAGGSIASWL